MGCCISRSELEDALEKFWRRAQPFPEALKILEDILKEKNMFPDSMIFDEQIPNSRTITCQPRSAKYIDVESHSVDDRLLVQPEHASNADELKYYKTEMLRLHSVVQNHEIEMERLESLLRSLHEDIRRTPFAEGKGFESSNKSNEQLYAHGERQQSKRHYEKRTGAQAVLQAEKQSDYGTMKRESDVQHENQRSLDKLKKEIVALQEDKQVVDEKLNKEMQIRKEKQYDCEKLEKLLSENQRDHDQLKIDITHYKENQRDYEKLKMDMAALKEEKQRDHETPRGKLAEPTGTIQHGEKELTKQLTELQQEKQWDHDRLTEELAKLQQEKQRDHERLTEELAKLQQEKQWDHDRLTEDLAKLQQEKHRDHERLIEKLTELQQEKQRDHERLTEGLTELQQEKQRDHKKLSEELTASKEEKTDVQMKLNEKIGKLEKELIDTSSKVKQLQDHQGQLQSALGRRDIQIVSMEKDMNSKTTELQRKEAGQKSRYSELNQEIGKLEDENETLSASIEKIQLENTDLKSELGEKEKEVQDCCNKNNTLSSNFDHLHRKHKSMQEELGGQIEPLKEDNKKKSSSIQELQQDKDRLVDQLGVTKDEFKTLKVNKDKLTQTLETEQQDHHTTRTDLREQIASLRGDNTALSFTVEKLQRNVSVLEKQLGVSEDELKTLRLNKDHLTEELETEQRKHHTTRTDLGEQIVALRGDNTALSSTVEKLHRTVAVLERQLGVKEEELKPLRLKKDQLTSELETEQQKHHTTRTDLGEQIASLRGDNAILSSTVEKLHRTVAVLERQLGVKEEELKTLRLKKDQLTSELETEQQKHHTTRTDLGEQIVSLRGDNTALSSTVDELKLKVAEVERQHNSVQEALRTASMEKGQLEKEITSLRDEKQELHRDMSARLEDLRAANTELASNIEVLQQEKETLQKKFDAKDDELQTILRELREAAERAKRKSVVLSIRSEKSGMGKTMVDMVTKEITKRLDGKVDKSCMDLTIQPHNASAGALGGPLVVLCLNMSRIGTNIQDTLKGIKVDKDVIVLVLHHTSKENLSSLTPTSLRVTGSEFRQLGGIIDMAFDSNSGLYACELNTTAIEKLAIILKKY